MCGASENGRAQSDDGPARCDGAGRPDLGGRHRGPPPRLGLRDDVGAGRGSPARRGRVHAGDERLRARRGVLSGVLPHARRAPPPHGTRIRAAGRRGTSPGRRLPPRPFRSRDSGCGPCLAASLACLSGAALAGRRRAHPEPGVPADRARRGAMLGAGVVRTLAVAIWRGAPASRLAVLLPASAPAFRIATIVGVARLPWMAKSVWSGRGAPSLDGPAVVLMGLTFAVLAPYGTCAATLGDRALGRPRAMAWPRGGFAGAFALFGLRAATATRRGCRRTSIMRSPTPARPRPSCARTSTRSTARSMPCWTAARGSSTGPSCSKVRRPAAARDRPRRGRDRPGARGSAGTGSRSGPRQGAADEPRSRPAV